MRIIGGAARGTKLADVGLGDASAQLRPTSDRVREAIFNLLINGGYGNPVMGAQVLDLFAGTGALGLEALSRGAGRATFVENGTAALALLAQNIDRTKTLAQVKILRQNALHPAPAGPAFDLVFLDPPYGRHLGEAALPIWAAQIAPEALIVWEENTPPAPPAGFETLDQRRYGDTIVTILAKA